MAESTLAWTIGLIAALLVGGIFGHLLFPVTNTVTKEVPGPTKEVVKEVVKEVSKETKTDYAQKALDTILERFRENDVFLNCSGLVYGPNDVKVSYVYPNFDYNPINTVDNKYSVTVKARFAFDDGSRQRNICYDTRTYKVTYQDVYKPLIEQL